MMTITELLRSVGQVDTDGRVSITTARPDGSETTTLVESIPTQNGPPLVGVLNALGITRPLFRGSPIATIGTSSCRSNRRSTSTTAAARRIRSSRSRRSRGNVFAAVDANPAAVERVVVDLRLNSGGDSARRSRRSSTACARGSRSAARAGSTG